MKYIFQSTIATTALIVLTLSGCGSDGGDQITPDQATHNNLRNACADGGETVIDGYYEREIDSSALNFQFYMVYNSCTSVMDFTDASTNRTCSLVTTYDGPLNYSYSSIPSGEPYDFELNLDSPEPLTFSINDRKLKIEFKQFKLIRRDTQKTYFGTIVVDDVAYKADKIIPFIENSLLSCRETEEHLSVVDQSLRVASEGQARAANPQVLARNKGCFNCHAVANRLVGPPYRDVAARYTAKDTDYLIKKVLEGSSGIWGVPHMPPNRALGVTEKEAEELVRWILTLK
jgi:cytochrome c